MARYEMRDTRYETGSALILAVVLTSLLAIIGVMFVMVARVDKIATSAISENRELNFAVETVIAKISQVLVLDVPGLPGQEYYDYPDANNAWLASLEPYDSGGYKWRQISDVTGFLADNNYDADDVDVDPPGLRKYIPEYPEITLDASGELDELWADADGDGVADSKWIELEGINSNKGRPIYAAIRVIDNGGMLNVNTARQFDPNSAAENEIDGSSQTQINLFALAERGASNFITDLDNMRRGREIWDLDDYIKDVVWRYYPPAKDTEYTPFDLSDELELRNRFILDQHYIKTRIEDKDKLWSDAFCGKYYLWTPVDGSGGIGLNDWFYKAQNDFQDPNAAEPEKDYSYRHIGTIYNMDRIIDPDGNKMVNINRDDANSIYGAMKSALDPNFADVNDVAAQITVNLIDYRDIDSDVTDYNNPDDGKIYYGFERPCVYISELAHRFKTELEPGGTGTEPGIRYRTYRSYAIELYKPYLKDIYPKPNQWRLVIDGTDYDIDWSGTKYFHVLLFEDPCVPLVVNFDARDYDPNLALSGVAQEPSYTRYSEVFKARDSIELRRRIDDFNDVWIAVDSVVVPSGLPNDGNPHSIRRDINPHKCIRRLLSGFLDDSTLGGINNYTDPSLEIIPAHPEDKPFTNVGEIGMVFRKGAYYKDIADRDKRIGYGTNKTEADVRLNLADPNFQQLFKYLTVFDPCDDDIDNDGDGMEDEDDTDGPEWKVAGRININTAPWYVIAQLPWMKPDIAQNVVSYRDDHDGFESIGELMNVDEIGYYADDSGDNSFPGGPDITPDSALDDFEERDVIFARISNLVTVRSDVFTAYILVRIGTDGPQKRVIAILDRSDVYPPGDGKVRVIALHPVPDPR